MSSFTSLTIRNESPSTERLSSSERSINTAGSSGYRLFNDCQSSASCAYAEGIEIKATFSQRRIDFFMLFQDSVPVCVFFFCALREISSLTVTSAHVVLFDGQRRAIGIERLYLSL